jgi:PPOX class probable F420-dependent enzyme
MSMPAVDVRRMARDRCGDKVRAMSAAILAPTARIDGLLRTEATVWLSTANREATPHVVPIWFSWDGERLFVASKPHARKVRDLRDNPRLMVALGEPDEDFDVGLVEAVAELPSASTADLLPPGHLEKYADRMRAIGLTPEEYVATYSQPILIRPTRFLPWHGRTVPDSAIDRAHSGREGLRGLLERVLAPLRPRGAFGASGA